ncbi:MAG: hypothetical protein CMP38_02605 [Rickettsiales bacterium]|nr:hypothetical protein [Rickettsiales bacterium]|tara:strand:- start:280 stop:1536 length:1257 start_codon:yes stop_codon:yes gene_type:complete
MRNLKIAVIGSGISGLSSAYYLSKNFKIDLFEKNSYFGGHTHTQIIKYKEDKINVDSGFIVFNQINYPNLCNLFEELNVESYASDMSFAVSNKIDNFEYSGTNLSSLFSQRKNLLNINFWRMLCEIVSFNLLAKKHIGKYKNYTIQEYLDLKNYSDYYKDKHLYPMAASIWSSEIDEIKKYPFEKFVMFFLNHGLLKIFNRPRWRTVLGGSKNYVEKILKTKNISAYKNSSVKFLHSKENKIFLDVKGKKKEYDHLIIAVHSDQVKNIINLKKEEKKMFEDIKYTKNKVYVHFDEKLMPESRKVWSSWNYIDDKNNKNGVNVTYWMNKLQKLNTNLNIFVSLNPSTLPSKEKLFKKIYYDHPLFDFNTFKNQKKITNIQGTKNIWFCGAYLGYGFHEDGITSALHIVKKILERSNEKN